MLARRERGQLDNTIVVVTSDHGEQFAERDARMIEHGNSLYLSTLHVPLLIRHPARLPQGVRVEDEVELRRLACTLLEVAGSHDHPLPGRSLAEFWSGRLKSDGIVVPHPPVSYLSQGVRVSKDLGYSQGEMWSVLDGGWHLIVNGDGTRELYDTRADPWERQNLAARADCEAHLTRLTDLLDTEPGQDHRTR